MDKQPQGSSKRLPLRFGVFAAAAMLTVSTAAGGMQYEEEGAYEQEGAHEGMQHEQDEMTFEQLDQAGDGVITREEAEQYPELQERFDEFDLTGDGQLTEQEFDIAKRELQQQERETDEHEMPDEEDDPWGEDDDDADDDDWGDDPY